MLNPSGELQRGCGLSYGAITPDRQAEGESASWPAPVNGQPGGSANPSIFMKRKQDLIKQPVEKKLTHETE